MTRHRDNRTPVRREAEQSVSSTELAHFLRALAEVYRNPITGNVALSVALKDLARRVARENYYRPAPRPYLAPRIAKPDRPGRFRTLELRAVEALLSNPSKTKLELVQVGSERFAIPRAKLMRLKIEEVREAIRAALRNEQSLRIISQEAQRGGDTRSS